jgi:hypothetical protein
MSPSKENERRPATETCRHFTVDEMEFFFERAGMFEHDAGMTPEDADRKAVDAVIDWRLDRKRK